MVHDLILDTKGNFPGLHSYWGHMASPDENSQWTFRKTWEKADNCTQFEQPELHTCKLSSQQNQSVIGREAGTRWPLKLLLTWTILWLCNSSEMELEHTVNVKRKKNLPKYHCWQKTMSRNDVRLAFKNLQFEACSGAYLKQICLFKVLQFRSTACVGSLKSHLQSVP